MSSALQNVFPT